jgi:adenosine deaminase
MRYRERFYGGREPLKVCDDVRMSRRRPAIPGLFLLLLAASPAGSQPRRVTSSPAEIAQRFAQLRNNPLELYAFLYRMPKGGDLHTHLSGAVYAESLLRYAAQDHLCIDRNALAIVAGPAAGAECMPGQVDAGLTQTDNALENAMINSLSMRDFVPGAESGHDHFFATFDKFGHISGAHAGEFVAEVVERAADQNESYLELMALTGGKQISELGSRVGLDSDFESTRKKLDDAGLAKLVSGLSAHVDQMEEGRVRLLNCGLNPDSASCRVQVHYIFQVLRESPKGAAFAQVLAGFSLAASDARVVAVNFVQPEDGHISMHDFHLQMQMLDYAKRIYPSVHLTLHAGELASGLVPPDGLRFHVREAVELGHAERIGHGTDVMYEKNAGELLAEMSKRRVAVEVNLTSSDLILGVQGDRHPFPIFRKSGVPVVLSTDDEGVSRTHLTQEFQRAVMTYNLSYPDLKQIVRNSLEYSFAPGASYWTTAGYVRRVSACASGRHTSSCEQFLQKNEKACLQADLEERFTEFEHAVMAAR